MTHTSRPAPPAPAPALAGVIALHRLCLAWGEAMAAPAIYLAWSTLCLWDYPRPQTGPACSAASPEPR
jgi:hypothetical protein